MKNNFLKFKLLLLTLTLVCFMFGCRAKKEVIKFDNEMVSFDITGGAKPAPSFVGGVGFDASLNINKNSFSAPHVIALLVFQLANGEFCFIYVNNDNERILTTSDQKKKNIRLNSANDFEKLKLKISKMKQFEFAILNKTIVIEDIDCVKFWWGSTGVRFFGLESTYDGVISLFKTGFLKKMSTKNSGKIYFTKWSKKNKNWPEIHSIKRGDRFWDMKYKGIPFEKEKQ